MDSVFAIAGDNCVIIASDRSATKDIFRFSEKDLKLTKINDNQVLAVVGDASETKSFAKYIECTIDYHNFRYGTKLSVDETASFIRSVAKQNHNC